MTRRRQPTALVVALLSLAVALLTLLPGSVTTSAAQVLPPPPTVPAPPEDGNPVSDVLGPSLTGSCDTLAVVFALAGPIATAQIPPDLQPLVRELEPYIGTALVACGFLASPPTGRVCDADAGVSDLFTPLGLPVSVPAATAQFHDTVAGIERAFLRVGVDIGRDTSTRLAEALGCSVPEPDALPDPAAVPTPVAPGAAPVAVPSTPVVPVAGGGFAALPGAAVDVPAAVTPVAGEQTVAAPVTVTSTTPVPTGLFWNPLTYVVPLALLVVLARTGRSFTASARAARWRP